MSTYSGAVSGTKNDACPWSLSGSDQPGMALVTSHLVGSNFISWSLAIKTALEAKDKLGFIDGTIKEPKDESEFKKWKPVDSMVKSWVRNSMSKDLAESFMFCRTSRELWKELEERYGVKSGPKFYQLQQDLASLRQGGDSVTSYYNKIHRFWDEIHRLRPVPRCICGKCGCEFNKKLDALETDTRLLIGYPEWFKELREQRKKSGKKNVAAAVTTDTPIDSISDKGTTDYAGVMAALQELTKIVKGKTEQQHVNFANLGEFADAASGKQDSMNMPPMIAEAEDTMQDKDESIEDLNTSEGVIEAFTELQNEEMDPQSDEDSQRDNKQAMRHPLSIRKFVNLLSAANNALHASISSDLSYNLLGLTGPTSLG
ncbi:uncharacterized protein G2W53_036578 [Senna tora]|uniref:Retrotransposon Copia-like N-terminal domain-containing protein n=1 Tax=Senna tora TaxID=362788 RepID=A0A834SW69_9FABA|nr:uncharacterized protein G2W53_036578 [Senna tora]